MVVAVAVLLPLLLVQTLTLCCTEVTQPSFVQLHAIDNANKAKAGVVAPSGPVIALPAAPPVIAVAAVRGQEMALAPVLQNNVVSQCLFWPSFGPPPGVPKHAVAFPPVGPAASGIQGPNVPTATDSGIWRQHSDSLCMGLQSPGNTCNLLVDLLRCSDASPAGSSVDKKHSLVQPAQERQCLCCFVAGKHP